MVQWPSASRRSAGVAAPRTVPPRGRVVVVLGASSGIGRACARAFARQGATVVLVARGEERLAAARQECVDEGAAASLALPADVLDQDRLHDVVDLVTSTYGRIDVVVHSANVMAYGRLEQVPPAVFERTVATAIHGTANLARAVVPTLRAQGFGTLVIVTSLLASVPVPWMGAYIAGKWGQEALARVLQIEQRDVPGVHVCTVAPGSVDTPIFRQAANFAGRSGRPPPPVASADAVARAVVRSADRPKRRRSVGLANWFIVLGYRLLPRVYDWLVGPLARLGAFARDTRAPTDGNVFAPLRPLVDDDQRPRAPRAGSGNGSHL